MIIIVERREEEKTEIKLKPSFCYIEAGRENKWQLYKNPALSTIRLSSPYQIMIERDWKRLLE